MIKDSGERKEFETGAVRDIQKGKGRCDLLPLEEVADLFIFEENTLEKDEVLMCIHRFISKGQEAYLETAIWRFICKSFGNVANALLELSVHFEEGAEKYGENNWRRGLPCHCYVNSGIRHYLKYKRGDTDERHDRAFVWNMVCLLWTVHNKPELNDLPYAKEKATKYD